MGTKKVQKYAWRKSSDEKKNSYTLVAAGEDGSVSDWSPSLTFKIRCINGKVMIRDANNEVAFTLEQFKALKPYKAPKAKKAKAARAMNNPHGDE